MDICKIAVVGLYLVSVTAVALIILFPTIGYTPDRIISLPFFILPIVFLIILKKHPSCKNNAKTIENYWPVSDNIKKTKLKHGFVKLNLRTDILGNVSIKNFHLRRGDILKIHDGAMLELKGILYLENGGILENNGILNNKLASISNNMGLIINNGLILNQGYNFGLVRIGLIDNDIQLNKFPGKPDEYSWGIRTNNPIGPSKYIEGQYIYDEIAISRTLNTRDDESLTKFLEHMPLIKTGIQNNGKIINTSMIRLNNNTEFYNSQEGIIDNYNRFLIDIKTKVTNNGNIFSSKTIANDHNITGNLPIFSTEKFTRKQINSIIMEEIQNYGKSNNI